MKYEELIEYSKEALVNTIIDYQDQIINLKRDLEKETIRADNNSDRAQNAEKTLEKCYTFAYDILNDKGETFGY